MVLFWGGSTASAQTPVPVTISGTVTNGTAGGELPDDLMVRLVSIETSADGVTGVELFRIETAVRPDGSFEFADMVLTGDICRVVVLAPFYTPTHDIPNCQNTTNIALTMWDTTDALDNVTLQNYGIILPVVNRADRTLLFLAFATVLNSSDRVWVPDIADPNLTGLDLLRFNLPTGFFQLNVEEGIPRGVAEGLFQSISTGFALTTPIPPNQTYTLLISYGAPYQGNVFEWPLRLPHGATTVQLSLPTEISQVTGAGLEFVGTDAVQDMGEFNIYRGSNYAPGDAINLMITGLPQPTWYQALGNFLTTAGFIWTITITVAVIFAIVVIAVIIRKRKAHEDIDIDDF